MFASFAGGLPRLLTLREARAVRRKKNLPAERFAAMEVTAGLRARFVERAKASGGIERDAGAIAALIHATRAVVFDDKAFRHDVAGAEFDDEVAAATAAGAGRRFEVEGDDDGAEPVGRGEAMFSCARLWLRARGIAGGLRRMGAKYLPTVKDQKATQRFMQKQRPLPKFKKASEGGTAKRKQK